MKAKPIILFAATLIIGFVLGMLTSAQLRFNKLKPMRVYFSEQRFREGFYQAIEPDEKQKVVIDEILDKYAKINSGFQAAFRRNLDSTMKEFRKELDLNLTKEQLARLKEMDEQRQKMIRESRRRSQDNDEDRRSGHRRQYHDRDQSDERYRQGQDTTNSNR